MSRKAYNWSSSRKSVIKNRKHNGLSASARTAVYAYSLGIDILSRSQHIVKQRYCICILEHMSHAALVRLAHLKF